MKRILVLFIAFFICNAVIAQEKKDTIINGYKFEHLENHRNFSFYNIADYEKVSEFKSDSSTRYDDTTIKYPKNIAKIYSNLTYDVFKDSPYFESIKDELFSVEINLNTEGEIIFLLFDLYLTKEEFEKLGYDNLIKLYEAIKNSTKYPPYSNKNKAQKRYTSFWALLTMNKYELDE